MKTYGEERSFLESCGVRVVELSDESGRARVCLVPAWQGRVMTSTAAGTGGPGYGWINRSLIASGVRKSRFNPFGGEERLWLGPEGGPFSLYFAPGAEQVYANWQVPAALDTEPFRVVGRDARQVRFEAEMSLRNAAGTRFEIGVARRVELLSHRQAEVSLGRVLPPELALVAYRSENSLRASAASCLRPTRSRMASRAAAAVPAATAKGGQVIRPAARSAKGTRPSSIS